MLKQAKNSQQGLRPTFSQFKKDSIISPEQQKKLKGGDGEGEILPLTPNIIGDTEIMGG